MHGTNIGGRRIDQGMNSFCFNSEVADINGLFSKVEFLKALVAKKKKLLKKDSWVVFSENIYHSAANVYLMNFREALLEPPNFRNDKNIFYQFIPELNLFQEKNRLEMFQVWWKDASEEERNDIRLLALGDYFFANIKRFIK